MSNTFFCSLHYRVKSKLATSSTHCLELPLGGLCRNLEGYCSWQRKSPKQILGFFKFSLIESLLCYQIIQFFSSLTAIVPKSKIVKMSIFQKISMFPCAVILSYITSDSQIIKARCCKIIVFLKIGNRFLLNTDCCIKYLTE